MSCATMRLALALTGLFAVATHAFEDCATTDATKVGPYTCTFFNATDAEGVTVFGLVPEESIDGGFPVLAFAHGGTGSWDMTQFSLGHICTHGFAVVFPHIKGPVEDTRFWNADPMGGFMLKAIDYIELAASDPSSILGNNKIDPTRVILGGTSKLARESIFSAWLCAYHALPYACDCADGSLAVLLLRARRHGRQHHDHGRRKDG